MNRGHGWFPCRKLLSPVGESLPGFSVYWVVGCHFLRGNWVVWLNADVDFVFVGFEIEAVKEIG